VKAEAAANGRLVVQTRLVAPDGQPYGPVVSFPVQATGIGQVAQWIVGGALVLLTVALTVRIGRAIRRGRHPAPAADEEPS
jgi:Na+-driven multidrug efflux pump